MVALVLEYLREEPRSAAGEGPAALVLRAHRRFIGALHRAIEPAHGEAPFLHRDFFLRQFCDGRVYEYQVFGNRAGGGWKHFSRYDEYAQGFPDLWSRQGDAVLLRRK